MCLQHCLEGTCPRSSQRAPIPRPPLGPAALSCAVPRAAPGRAHVPKQLESRGFPNLRRGAPELAVTLGMCEAAVQLLPCRWGAAVGGGFQARCPDVGGSALPVVQALTWA